METNDGIYADPQQEKNSGDTDSKGWKRCRQGTAAPCKKEIDRFVQQKSEWISFHQDKIKREREKQGSFSFLDGRFPLLGAMFPVEYLDEGKPFYHEGTFFLYKGSEEELCAQAQQLYRKIAREELSRRVAFYAQKMGVSPTAIRINGAKGRWGSCSGKNSLNFSWRLMMAPEHAVNYVVVHELCHILHHDHSREFWQEVERFSLTGKSAGTFWHKHHKSLIL